MRKIIYSTSLVEQEFQIKDLSERLETSYFLYRQTGKTIYRDQAIDFLKRRDELIKNRPLEQQEQRHKDFEKLVLGVK